MINSKLDRNIIVKTWKNYVSLHLSVVCSSDFAFGLSVFVCAFVCGYISFAFPPMRTCWPFAHPKQPGSQMTRRAPWLAGVKIGRRLSVPITVSVSNPLLPLQHVNLLFPALTSNCNDEMDTWMKHGSHCHCAVNNVYHHILTILKVIHLNGSHGNWQRTLVFFW